MTSANEISTATTTRKVRRIILSVFAAGALAALIGTYVSGQSLAAAQHEELLAAQQHVTDIETAGREQVAESTQLVTEANLRQVGAMRPERLTADAEAIHPFLDIALTWSSDLEYSEARETIQRRFGLGPDSQFLTEFMPPSPHSVDGEGNVYYYIDAKGLNSRLGTFSISPVGIDGSLYRYIVIVSASSLSPDGKGSSSLPIIIDITVDADGTFTDVQAQSTNHKPRNAGEMPAISTP